MLMKNHLALDIETVPLQDLSEYSTSVQEKIFEKIERRQSHDPKFDYNYFASLHGDFGKIICLSLGYIAEDESIRLKSFWGEDEHQILLQFNETLEKHQGIYLHYNGLNFDVPFILQRMAHHGLAPAGNSFSNMRRFSAEPHFDVMMMYYNWDLQKALPLGILAELYSIPSPKEELSGDKIFEVYQAKEWTKIIHYCEFDTATTLNLWRKIFLYQPAISLEHYFFSK
jgi:predicted PolB exonuclease-like 3'-5' exonuclease